MRCLFCYLKRRDGLANGVRKLDNEKHERFCREYLKDLCAKDAAIRAGYSEKAAKNQGYRLIHRPEVKERVAELIRERAERTEVTVDRVVQELAAVAFADISDFVEVVTVSGEGKSEQQDVVIKDTRGMEPAKLKAVAGIKQGTRGIEIKMNDKIRALEQLGKHLGMYREKVEHEVPPDFTINIMPASKKP